MLFSETILPDPRLEERVESRVYYSKATRGLIS